MGLDAVVFRNIRALEAAYGRGLFDLDETTGEALLRPNAGIAVPREAYFASDKRLGNAAMIGHLHKIVEETPLGADSFITRRILYSGTHGGDSIELHELPRLADELAALKALNLPDLALFIENMEALLKAALAEQNPIVF